MSKSRQAFLSVQDYWDGIANALNARLSVSKKYLQHPVAGFSAEAYYTELLREYVPTRYAVASGFVVNSSGHRSQHIDIIIADTHHIPPLCSEPTYRVFAAESVCAAIEVTTAPRGRDKNLGKLEQDIRKLAEVRALCKERHYFEMQPVVVGKKIEYQAVPFVLTGTRCYLITSGDEWKSADTYQRNVVAGLHNLRAGGKQPWLNAAYSVRHGLLEFVAYTDFLSQWSSNNALLAFLLAINQGVNTFSTFKVDLRRYAKSLAAG